MRHAGRSGIEGERKQVTVLFADVSGFTALSESLDPEDVRGNMDRCYRVRHWRAAEFSVRKPGLDRGEFR